MYLLVPDPTYWLANDSVCLVQHIKTTTHLAALILTLLLALMTR